MNDFESWLVAREPALQRLAHLLAPDPHTAADLVQTTLTKLYVAWPRISDRGQVDAYARRVLVNAHRSWWRRAFRRHEAPTGELPERATAAGTHDTTYDGTRDAVWSAVRDLPERQRAVLVLRYYEDLTERETAEVLGISVGTVKSQASRALDRLRRDVPSLADHLSPQHPQSDLSEQEQHR